MTAFCSKTGEMKARFLKQVMEDLLKDRNRAVSQLIILGTSELELIRMGFTPDEVEEEKRKMKHHDQV